MDIATGAPQVIGKRMQMLQPSARWSWENALEAQRMVMEKLAAASEVWWALCGATFMAWPVFGSKRWLRPASQLRLTHQHARTANQALAPLARRVNANVRRLRNR